MLGCGVTPNASTYVECPECHAANGVVAGEWPWGKSYFCPECEHAWGEKVKNPSATNQPDSIPTSRFKR